MKALPLLAGAALVLSSCGSAPLTDSEITRRIVVYSQMKGCERSGQMTRTEVNYASDAYEVTIMGAKNKARSSQLKPNIIVPAATKQQCSTYRRAGQQSISAAAQAQSTSSSSSKKPIHCWKSAHLVTCM